MRCIGTLGDEKQIERFVAFLVTNKILAHIDREGGDPKIWIKNEDDVAAAQQHLARFVANPNAPEFENVVERANEILRLEAKKRTEARKLIRSFSSQMRLGPTYRAPLTFALTALCVVLWFLQSFALSPNAPRENANVRLVKSSLFRALTFTAIPPTAWSRLRQQEQGIQMRGYNLVRGEAWRLVTPIFIHFGAWHLAFNLIALYQLGRVLEDRYGTSSLGVVIVVIAVISNALQMGVPIAWGGLPIVSRDGWGVAQFGGISGVVFGLLGLAWMKSRYDWSAGFYVPRATIVWALAWIVLGMSPLDELLFGVSMANWAHGAGFVVGVIIGYAASMRHLPRTPKSP